MFQCKNHDWCHLHSARAINNWYPLVVDRYRWISIVDLISLEINVRLVEPEWDKSGESIISSDRNFKDLFVDEFDFFRKKLAVIIISVRWPEPGIMLPSWVYDLLSSHNYILKNKYYSATRGLWVSRKN